MEAARTREVYSHEKETFIIIHTPVLRRLDTVSSGAERLYNRLREYSDSKYKPVFPKVKTLASRLDVSEESIRRYIKELEEGEIIRVERKQGGRNRYCFITDETYTKSDTTQVTGNAHKNEGCNTPQNRGDINLARSLPPGTLCCNTPQNRGDINHICSVFPHTHSCNTPQNRGDINPMSTMIMSRRCCNTPQNRGDINLEPFNQERLASCNTPQNRGDINQLHPELVELVCCNTPQNRGDINHINLELDQNSTTTKHIPKSKNVVVGFPSEKNSAKVTNHSTVQNTTPDKNHQAKLISKFHNAVSKLDKPLPQPDIPIADSLIESLTLEHGESWITFLLAYLYFYLSQSSTKILNPSGFLKWLSTENSYSFEAFFQYLDGLFKKQERKKRVEKRIDPMEIEDRLRKEYYELQEKVVQEFQKEHIDKYTDIRTQIEDEQEYSNMFNKRGSRGFEVMVRKSVFQKICEVEKLAVPRDFEVYRRSKI
jgi:DNA-binding transcriptional ArsR family regulator